ncbi:MAG: stage II sporulation protein D [Eubacteriaceae bacterium]|nr:stage II sporulation protein D [Eubacteriaceae bacterium]
MRNRNNLDKKIILLYIAFMLVFTLLLPLIAVNLFPRDTASEKKNFDVTIPDKVTLYRVSEDRYEKIDFEEYVEGVVAAEMPDSFEFEALKAQAVASRTYALGRVLAGAKLCDTIHCQAYRNTDISSKVKKAVKATRNQLLAYEDELASHALYFSSSGGPTENSEDVFSGKYPYLRSVSSSNEPGATHVQEKTVLNTSEFSDVIKKAYPELDFGSIKKSNIKILSHSAGGRVDKIKVGKQTLTGTDIRKALAIPSTRFSVSFDGKKIILTSDGSGHGVGMSQYGANGMAKEGKTYEQILSHYYKGTKVKAGHS